MKSFASICSNTALFSAFIFFVSLLPSCTGETVADLEAGFLNPPDEARPRVWWHWMNGNITKEGIKADLEWMHRTGIRGFQNFDAALLTPQVVEKRLVYMTPEWKDAFRYTTKIADSLGLEMAIAGSPGWSESGGPWVTPAQAMKKYVWSQIRVTGGKTFSGILPTPFTATGPFRNLPLREGFSLSAQGENKTPEFYADAAVVAFRAPESDVILSSLNPKITSSGGKFTLEALTDGNIAETTLLPYVRPGENAWIMYEFPEPQSFSSLSIVGGGFGGTFGFGADTGTRSLEISDDGKNFRKAFDIPRGGVEQKTMTFDPLTARFFRFTWETPQPQPSFDLSSIFGGGSQSTTGSRPGPTGIAVSELVLYKTPRINRFEEKAAFATASGLYDLLTPEVKPEESIKKSEVIDLTTFMKPDGTLEWTPPEGEWIIIRLGYSLTGHRNSPASPEATGLEVDKLSVEHVSSYFNHYLDLYKDATAGLMGKKGLQYIITDSWEAGTQNWTDNMMEEFSQRRGYDMLTWIPVLTGHIVESAGASEKFLWDFRKTIGELTTENHYDQLTEILAERGMARYTESHESGRAFIGDGMEVKRKAAIPMSATWTPGGLDPGTEVATRYKADVRESASVAHIYGQNIVAAESMTAIGSAWAWSPELLKPTADMEMANGLNRFVIHTSVHQPVDDKIPGVGLGPFGQWFTRHETWAEQAKPWIDYLARSCYMLQQGEFVADIVYYYGDDNNITSLFNDKLPYIPEGYNYDFINTDALLNLLSVKNGMLVTQSGMSYKLLALDSNCVYMTLPVLRKINELVTAGALVSGPKPIASPSLSDNAEEFSELADKLWPVKSGVTTTGTEKVIAGIPLENVLSSDQILPDFAYTGSDDKTKLLFVHRKAGDTDYYWINNRNSRAENIDARFRIRGKTAEIWNPVTGKIVPASYAVEGEFTKVNLRLEPEDAVFVVFRGRGNKTHTEPEPAETVLSTVEGPWAVTFQPGRGAPATSEFETLSPWNENKDNGIRYFSGTATYSKTININGEWLETSDKLILDLGDVKNLAEVIVNGKSAGIVWKTPFRIETGSFFKAGDNKIEIKVTNLWVNRLIGDQQPDAKERLTYTTMPFYRADSKLLPSGLIGPVKIISLN